jgi:hypothetical protein
MDSAVVWQIAAVWFVGLGFVLFAVALIKVMWSAWKDAGF